MSKNRTVTKTRDEWKGYVNWSPNAKEKEQILDYSSKPDFSVSSVITSLTEGGYGVSFGWEEKGGASRISVTGRSNPCPNIGYTLSIRGSSVDRCCAIAGYYCDIICGSGDWLVDKKEGDVW